MITKVLGKLCNFQKLWKLPLMQFISIYITSKSTTLLEVFVMRCAIWYHLSNLKNVENTPGGVLILVKLQAN